MTGKQQKILAFIAERLQERGAPPTLREIGARFKIASTSSVSYHLGALERAGVLKRRQATSRGLGVLHDPLRLPILGRVSAGAGSLAQQDIEGYVTFKSFKLGSDYLLRVRGDSMIEAGIMEGDLVQVRRQMTADDGDIVVALIEDEAVVKRLKRRGGGYALESANPRYAPITLGFQVIGKVLGLLRQYGR